MRRGDADAGAGGVRSVERHIEQQGRAHRCRAVRSMAGSRRSIDPDGLSLHRTAACTVVADARIADEIDDLPSAVRGRLIREGAQVVSRRTERREVGAILTRSSWSPERSSPTSPVRRGSRDRDRRCAWSARDAGRYGRTLETNRPCGTRRDSARTWRTGVADLVLCVADSDAALG